MHVDGMALTPEKASQAVIAAHRDKRELFTAQFCDDVLGNEFKNLQHLGSRKSSKAQILLSLGIDFSRHSGQPLPAFVQMTGLSDESFFIQLIQRLAKAGHDLSDKAFNSRTPLDLHEFFPGIQCEECSECKPLKQIARQSVYAKCLRVFGSWDKALVKSEVDPQNYKRKIAAREPGDYLNELFEIFASDERWSVKTIRKNPAAWGLRHERNQESLVLYSRNIAPELVREGKWVFAAWVQYKANEQKTDPIQFYEANKTALWDQYQAEHMLQEEWPDKRIERELLKAFSAGRRITRYELASSEVEFDRTLLAASRAVKHRQAGFDHNDQLVKAGFIPKVLATIYAEQDDKWNRIRCFQEAQRLVGIYLESGQPTLSREWCRLNAREFHDALLRKVNGKSWESGLRWIGLDPKKFSIHASPRTKRGLVFQEFFKEQLLIHGFEEVMCQEDLDSPRQFLYGKSLPNCSHGIKCRPDFLFRDFILDTKTGIGAISHDNDQLQRYCDHRKIVYLLTLNNAHSERKVGNGIVVTFSFKEFVDSSLHVLGVALTADLPSRLTQLLNEVISDRELRSA